MNRYLKSILKDPYTWFTVVMAVIIFIMIMSMKP